MVPGRTGMEDLNGRIDEGEVETESRERDEVRLGEDDEEDRSGELWDILRRFYLLTHKSRLRQAATVSGDMEKRCIRSRCGVRWRLP